LFLCNGGRWESFGEVLGFKYSGERARIGDDGSLEMRTGHMQKTKSIKKIQ